MFGLNNLFWYYSASVRGQVEVVVHVFGTDDPPLQAEAFFGTYVTFIVLLVKFSARFLVVI